MRFFTSYRFSITAPNNIVAPNNFHDIADGTSNTLLLGG